MMALIVSLTSYKTILLDCIVTAVITAFIFKNVSKLVNFCVALLILKMEENKQHFWHTMLYYFKKGKNATEMQEKICAVHGEGAVTDQTSKWFAKFPAEDFSVDDAPWWGSPDEVDSDQIETLIENNDSKYPNQ